MSYIVTKQFNECFAACLGRNKQPIKMIIVVVIILMKVTYTDIIINIH